MWSYRNVNRSLFCTLSKELFDGLFIFYWFCWFFIRFSRSVNAPIPYLNNWLTDLVFVPIIIHFSSVIGSFQFNKNRAHGYPLYQIWTISFLVSILFEWIMPKYTSYNTGDIIDILAYFSGGLFYFCFHQPYYIRRNFQLAQQQEAASSPNPDANVVP